MIKNHWSRLFGMKVWAPITMACLVILVAFIFNVLGIHFMKGLPAWQEWRTLTYWHFFAWRVVLYCIVLWGWLLYRDRLFQGERASTSSARRVEIAVFLSLLLVELIRALLRQGS